MKEDFKYQLEKYHKEYKCNYKIDEFTSDWNTVGKTDRYTCPECAYLGVKCEACKGGE